MKLKYKKKEKSAKGNLKAKEACHWYHDTLSDARTKKKPFKRFRYLFFPFQITFKVLKVPLNGFCCNMNLEYTHNISVIWQREQLHLHLDNCNTIDDQSGQDGNLTIYVTYNSHASCQFGVIMHI